MLEELLHMVFCLCKRLVFTQPSLFMVHKSFLLFLCCKALRRVRANEAANRPAFQIRAKKDLPYKDLEDNRAAYPEAVGTYLQSPLDWLQGLLKTPTSEKSVRR